ncbi:MULTISPECIES: hypothetical protein [unclassified Sphingopyxis]|uniref:hypothetical protein n=1 Tax=unclassified Sphingopyxis TaxID=2614943 RepID=UPI000B02134C|nr:MULTISPECIES: hypothetical protein [unclassified Sphingopyxis]
MARVMAALRKSAGTMLQFFPASAGKRRTAILLALLVAAPLAGCGKPTTDSVLADMESKEPFYAAIREKDPALHAQIRAILDRNIASGTPDAARAEIRKLVLPAIVKRVPDTSRETIVAFATLARDQGRFIAEEHPDLCPGYLRGDDMGFDKIADKAMIDRELAIYDQLLRSPPELGAPRASAEEVGQLFVTLIPRLRAKLGVSDEQLLAALEQRGPGKLQCSAATELFDEILKLPPVQRDRILRTMFAEI